MKKLSNSLIPWEIRTKTGPDDVDLTKLDDFLDDFNEVDVFAFLGVPDHSRRRYMDESLEMLINLDKAGKVFAPEDYREFLEEELRGLKVRYHSPESRTEEFKHIEENTDDIETMIAPSMDYTVPRNYAEASNIFDDVKGPQDNILVDFKDYRQVDGTLLSYLMADLGCLNEDNDGTETSYSINDSEIVFPGVSYSENSSDYFGINFFSPKSEAVRITVPQSLKDIPKKLMDFNY